MSKVFRADSSTDSVMLAGLQIQLLATAGEKSRVGQKLSKRKNVANCPFVPRSRLNLNYLLGITRPVA